MFFLSRPFIIYNIYTILQFFFSLYVSCDYAFKFCWQTINIVNDQTAGYVICIFKKKI